MCVFLSVLRFISARNKGGRADINIAQILHLSNFFELKRRVLYSFACIANQKNVTDSASISYFTNIAVQNRFFLIFKKSLLYFRRTVRGTTRHYVILLSCIGKLNNFNILNRFQERPKKNRHPSEECFRLLLVVLLLVWLSFSFVPVYAFWTNTFHCT